MGKRFFLIVFFLIFFLVSFTSAAVYNMSDYSTAGHKTYQKGGTAPSNPFDYTSEVSSGGYTNLTSDDNIYLITSLATTDQQYDSQIFHFNLSDHINNIQTLNITWKGKSSEQGNANYDLTAYVWNVSAGAWEVIAQDTDGSTTEVSWTKNITSNTLHYVNSTSSGKFVYIMVKYKKLVACPYTCCDLTGYTCSAEASGYYCASGVCCSGTCSPIVVSCPYFYSWNGTDYVFDSEGITAFGLISDNEGKQPSRLPNLKSVNGTVKIKVTEELPEISHIDSVELLKVTHSGNVSVYPGYKETSLKGYPEILGFDVPLFIFKYFKKKGDSVTKQFFEKEDVSTIFTLYTLKNQIKPLKVTEDGKEIKELFEIDGKFWNKDLEGLNLSDEDGDGLLDIKNPEEFTRSVEFLYPREETEKAKLRINIKETNYMPFVASQTIESAKRLGVYDAKKLLKNAPRDSAYNITIWDGEKWSEPLYVNLYPREMSTDVVVPLDLTGIDTPYLRVRIQVSHGLLALDGAYIDYSDDEEIIIERIPLESAVDNNGKDVTSVLSNTNNKKVAIEYGDYLNLEFKGKDENATFFLNMRGYYEPSSFKEDYIITDKEIIEKIYDEEAFGKRYWKLKYLESQTSCSGNDKSNNEDEHNTLYTDYVELKTSNFEFVLPTVMINAPQNTTYNNILQLVNITSSDASGVVRTWYSWNHTNYTYAGNTSFFVKGGNVSYTAGTPAQVSFTSNMSNTNYSILFTGGNNNDDSPFAIEWFDKQITGFKFQIEDDGGANESGTINHWAVLPWGEYDLGGFLVKCGNGSGVNVATTSFTSNFLNTSYAVVAYPPWDDDSPRVSYTSKNINNWTSRIEDDADGDETVASIDWCAVSYGVAKTNTGMIQAGYNTTNGISGKTISLNEPFPDTNYVVVTMASMAGLTADPCAVEIYGRTTTTFNVTAEDDDTTNNCAGREFNWIAISSGENQITPYFNFSEGLNNITAWAEDLRGNINTSGTIYFTVTHPQILLNRLYPTTDLGIPFHDFFNITLNVTCIDSDCGDINVSLDPENWWNSAWSYRKTINIISVGDLTSFPSYINVSYVSGMQTDYDDLRFVNGSCSSEGSVVLPYEIENYTSSNAHIWIKTNLTSGVNSICMYYNNSDASSGQNKTAVWATTDLIVEHFNTNVSFDSSPNLMNGTMSTGIQTTGGVTGNAINFTTNSSYVKYPNNYGQTNNTGTISFWGKPENGEGFPFTYFAYWNSSAEILRRYGDNSWAKGAFQFYNTTYNDAALVNDGGGNLEYIVLLSNGTGWKHYSNGIETSIGMSVGTNSGRWMDDFKKTNYNMYLGWGNDGSSNNSLKGMMDEFRWSSDVKSAEWINQSYQMISNQASFVSFGTEEWSGIRSKSGLVNTTPGATPFYTNESNPRTINLNTSQYELVTFWVNATGDTGIYTFFEYANMTSNYLVSNTTSNYTVTILDEVDPVVNLISPQTGIESITDTVNFSCNMSDNYLIKNLTLYIWNSTNSLVHNNTTSLSGTFNETNWTYTFPREDNYTWNCRGYDDSANSAWSEQGNRTLEFITEKVFLQRIYPTTDINAEFHEFFNITLNVSCLGYDCGDINVSFDSNEDWWNYDWSYRQPINVSVSSGTTVQNYQTKIILNSSNVGNNFNWSRGCNDLRFVNGSNNAQLNYWIENCSSSSQNASIWVKVDNNISTSAYSIYMYYGNNNVNNVSDGVATFEFFDDFEGETINSSKWGSSGSISISGGIVSLDRTSSENVGLYSLGRLYDSKPSIVEVKYQHPSRYRNRLYLGGCAGCSSSVGYDYGIFDPSIYWNAWTGINLNLNTWYIVSWEDTTSNYIWKILTLSGSEVLSRNTSSPISQTGYITFNGTESANSDFKFDWVRARKYFSSEPSFILGLQENSSSLKGLINTTSGATPFYTNSSTNPITINLNETQSQLVTIWVNATGVPSTVHTFFEYANLTSNQTRSNITSQYNVTIIDTKVPVINLISPANAIEVNDDTLNFSCNISDEYDARNLTLYIWNSTSLVYSNTTLLIGTFNQTNWTYTFPKEENYTWNCRGYDYSNNSAWSEQGNRTLTFITEKVSLQRIYPTTNINAEFHEFFNLTFNVSCWGRDCGNINVSFYSNGSLTSIVSGTEPFYTNSSTNPITINLNETQSQIIIFWMNATGDLFTNYTFFEYVNITSNLTRSNVTSNYNVTIIDTPLPQLIIYRPQNTTYHNATQLINISATDTHLNKIWYNWNGTNYTYPGDSYLGKIKGGTADYTANTAVPVNFTSNMSNTNYSILFSGGQDGDSPFALEWWDKQVNGFKFQIEDDDGANESDTGNYWAVLEWGEFNLGGFLVKCGSGSGLNVSTTSFTSAFSDTNYAIVAYPSWDDDSPRVSYTAKSTSSWTSRIEDDADGIEDVSSIDWCAVSYGNVTRGNTIIQAGYNTTNATTTKVIPLATPFPDTNYVVLTMANMTGLTADPCAIEVTGLTTTTFNITAEDDDTTNNCNTREFNWIAITSGEAELNPYLNFSEGLNTLTAWANDTTGNTNFTNITFTIDLTYPTVNFVSPTPENTSVVNVSYIYTNVSASDVGRGNGNISVFIDKDNSLVSWWRMDDVNQTGKDAIVYDYLGRNNGTAYGDAQQTDVGKLGKAFEFDGDGEYIVIPYNDSFNFIGSFTISAWVKRVGGCHSSLCNIFSKWLTDGDSKKQYRVYLSNNDTPSLLLSSDGSSNDLTHSSEFQLNLGEWYLLTVVYNGSYAIWYINGEIKGNPSSYTSGIYEHTQPVIIGAQQAGSQWFNGSIDDVIIFNRSLNADEVLALYANTSSKYLGVNHTDLVNGSYSFTAYAQDWAGNVNSTNNRFNVDVNSSSIAFVSPTTQNNTVRNVSHIYTNVSASDVGRGDGNISVFIDKDNSLVSWWRMDDVNQTGVGSKVYDYTGKNNGTAYGDAQQTDVGMMGKAFEFDGSGDYVSVSAFTNPTEEITVSAWAKSSTENWNAYGWIASKRAAFVLHPVIDAKTVVWIVNNGSGDNGGVLAWNDIGYAPSNITQWHHYVGTYNSSSNISKLYVDGVERDSGDTQMGFINADSGVLTIGRDDGLDRYGNGSIDDVMIFNRSLNADEVLALYANTSSKYLEVNHTELEGGAHTFKAYVQDWAGNINSTAVNYTVTTPKINLDLIIPEDLDGRYVVQNEFFNVTVNVTCLDNDCGDINVSLDPIYCPGLGGTITNDGLYCVHTFTSNGSFAPSSDLSSVEVLVVAGGGGSSGGSGGGGAGGLIYNSSYSVSTENITVIVGSGGAGAGWSSGGKNGTNSSFGTLNARGGGAGTHSEWTPYAGGSGGGGYYAASIGGAGTPDQGNAGGKGFNGAPGYPGGGGGGAGASGANASNATYGADGGIGKNYTINGTNVYYAGGGGSALRAGGTAAGVGGLGGGGNGTIGAVNGGNGTANTGGGGGAAGDYATGGSGGSGIVIVRYLTPSKFGLVNDTVGATPFYTNESNPRTINLNTSQYELVTFWVNATGVLNTTHGFFAYANVTWASSLYSNITGEWNVTITYRPQITIHTPQQTKYNNATQLVNISVNSTIPDTIWYNWNGTNYTYTSALYINFSQGENTLIVWANDTSGFLNSTSVTFTVDLQAPTVDFVFPTPENNTLINVSNIYTNVSASDVGRGDGNISVFIDRDNSLVGWWRMDDVNQTGTGAMVYDYTGRNNGTAYGDAQQTDWGMMGKAFEFDGTTDYVNISKNPVFDFTGNYTLSAWINLDSIGSLQGVMGKYSASGWGMNINSNGKPNFGYHSCSNFDSSTILNVSEWYFLTMIYRVGGSEEIYVNGVSDGTGSLTSGNCNDDASDVVIGIYRTTGYFNGSIDDVMIFNRSLNADEVIALYANTSSKYLGVNYTDLSDGNHTFTAYAQDTSGNLNSLFRNIPIRTQKINLDLIVPEDLDGRNVSQNEFFNVTVNVTCVYAYCGEVNVSLNSSGVLTNTTSGATPFYTNESNPRNITLSENQSQLITFWVNATGAVLASPHSFFVYANLTSNMSNSNKTGQWNVTIVDPYAPQIIISSPQNTTYNNATQLVNITATDTNLNSAWYNWNGTNYTYTSTLYITFSEGLNTLRVWANDTTGNVNSTNVTFTIKTPKVYLNLLNPSNLNGVNVIQNEFFNVILNVTCVDSDCGNINVSLNSSGSSIIDDNFVYAAGATNRTVWKLYKENMTRVAYSPSYGGNIWSLGLDDNYVYVGGETNQTVWKLYKENMTRVTYSPSYGGIIDAISVDDNYVYVGGGTNQTVWKLYKENMTRITYSANYGGILWMLENDDNFVYAAGATNRTVWKLYKENMTRVAYSPSYGGDLYALYLDDNFVYAAGATNRTVWKLYKENMTRVAYSTSYGADINAIVVDDDFVYAGGMTNRTVWKIYKENMTIFAYSPSYGGEIWALGLDDNYVYVGGQTNQTVWKLYKENMTRITYSANYGGTLYKVSALGNKESWGLINTTAGATPFYTNESNPRTINLNTSQYEVVTFWVNATGDLNTTHLFFAFANVTWAPSLYSNITGQWNVTIVESMCNPSSDVNWTITDAQVCDTKNVNIGNGTIIINPSGSLTLIGSSNVTSSGLEIRRTGDSVYILSGSSLYIY